MEGHISLLRYSDKNKRYKRFKYPVYSFKRSICTGRYCELKPLYEFINIIIQTGQMFIKSLKISHVRLLVFEISINMNN